MTDKLQAPSRLSDPEYQELIAHRVHDAIRIEQRWRMGIFATILAAVVAVVYQALSARIEPVETTIESYIDRPFVDGLDTPFAAAERLIINGNAFGSIPGHVELFYKLSIEGGTNGDETRSVTITLSGRLIEEWSPGRVIVNTTQEQRLAFLNSFRPAQTSFDNLIPYIRIVTADGRRSPVW